MGKTGVLWRDVSHNMGGENINEQAWQIKTACKRKDWTPTGYWRMGQKRGHYSWVEVMGHYYWLEEGGRQYCWLRGVGGGARGRALVLVTGQERALPLRSTSQRSLDCQALFKVQQCVLWVATCCISMVLYSSRSHLSIILHLPCCFLKDFTVY